MKRHPVWNKLLTNLTEGRLWNFQLHPVAMGGKFRQRWIRNIAVTALLPVLGAKRKKTPMLWFGAENDAVKNLNGARSSTAYYGADFCHIKEVGHKLMMEQSYRDTALQVSKWLDKTVSI